VGVEKGNDKVEMKAKTKRVKLNALGVTLYALRVKERLLGVAENPFPELPFFTK
jgi:hypothetical protein